jgi:hypothetical protein
MPATRISGQVYCRDDRNRVVTDNEENPIGKSMRHGTAHWVKRDWKAQRFPLHGYQDRRYLSEKRVAQACLLFFVPIESFRDVELRIRADDQSQT